MSILWAHLHEIHKNAIICDFRTTAVDKITYGGFRYRVDLRLRRRLAWHSIRFSEKLEKRFFFSMNNSWPVWQMMIMAAGVILVPSVLCVGHRREFARRKMIKKIAPHSGMSHKCVCLIGWCALCSQTDDGRTDFDRILDRQITLLTHTSTSTTALKCSSIDR